MADIIGQAETAVLSAAPHEIQAHREFLSEALGELRRSGKDPTQVTQQAGAGNVDPREMTPAQLASTTLQLARRNPEIVKAIGEKYPQAQPLLSAVLSPEMSLPGVQKDGAMSELAGMLSR